MSKVVKIPKDAALNQYVDIERYKNVQPGILNMYYQTNLLDIIDKLPQQNKVQNNEQLVKANLSLPNPAQFQKTQVNTQALSSEKAVVLTNIVKAVKHQCDTLGNDIAINGYSISKTILGRGSHSFVKLAKKQGKSYAIKIIAYDRLKKRIIIKDQHITKMINSQINLLIKLKSENIIGFQQAIYLESKQRVFIVIEYCSKGSLVKWLDSAPAMTIQNWHNHVKNYMLQIAKGLYTMHRNNIIHRDMKAQNVLINEKDIVKIIDFNVSGEIPDNGMIIITEKFIGTKTYAPPQLVISNAKPRQVDGRLIDIWALGITFLELLQRKHPFNVNTPAQLIKRIQIPFEFSQKYHPDLRDLLTKMLKFQNADRIQITEVLAHPWFRS